MSFFLQINVMLPVIIGMSFEASVQANDVRPNIVFIFSDDHATQAIGAYGDRFAEFDPTPNIDRLAGEVLSSDTAG